MAYISTEKVKTIRERLKEAFPRKDGWKFSVTRRNAMAVCVVILEGPIEFKDAEGNDLSYSQVNKYHIDRFNAKESAEVLKKILDIMTIDYYDNSDIMTDYFDVAYYRDLMVGRWDRPYKKV
jgi:hypothetical protein